MCDARGADSICAAKCIIQFAFQWNYIILESNEKTFHCNLTPAALPTLFLLGIFRASKN